MKRTVVSLLLALVVAGCARTGREMLMAQGILSVRYFGTQAHDVPHTYDPHGIISEEYVMCEVERYKGFWLGVPVLGDDPIVNCPPTKVKITNDPNDEEAWATETRYAPFGATDPWGASPNGIAFLSRERCEAFRAEHPTYTKPHEVCAVIHFKRLSPGL